jgi:hypothetical protein
MRLNLVSTSLKCPRSSERDGRTGDVASGLWSDYGARYTGLSVGRFETTCRPKSRVQNPLRDRNSCPTASKTQDIMGNLRTGKPVRPTASTGFLGRAKEIEAASQILTRTASAFLHIVDVPRSRSATASAFFSRPSPEFPIGSRSCSLGGASRFTTSLSQPGCHPAPRPEEALQNRREIQVRVQFWKMDTETRRADLNLLQLRGCGLFQTLGIARRKAHL